MLQIEFDIDNKRAEVINFLFVHVEHIDKEVASIPEEQDIHKLSVVVLITKY